MSDTIQDQLGRVRSSLRNADYDNRNSNTFREGPDYWVIALRQREAELLSKLER